MHKLKLLSASIIGLSGLSLHVNASAWEQVPLETQWEYVQSNNSNLADIQKRLKDSEALLKFDILDSAEISVDTGTYLDLDQTEAEKEVAPDPEIAVELTGSVQVNNAVGVSAKVNSDDQSSLSLSVNVFADSYVTPDMRYNFEKTKLDLSQLTLSLQQTLQSKYLNVLLLEKKWKLSQLNQDVQKKNYLATLESFKLSESTFEEKSNARNSKIQSDNAVYQAQSAFLQAQLEYAQLSGDQDLAEFGVQNFLNLLESRNTFLTAALVEPGFSSQTLEDLKLEQVKLLAQRKNIKAYEPEVRLNSTYDIDDPALTLAMNVKFSLGQFRKDDQKEKDTEVSFNQADLILEAQNLELQKEMLVRQLSMAKQSLMSQITTLEEQVIITRETQFLFEQGERTQLELLKQQYSLENAKVSEFESAMNVFSIQQNLYTGLSF